MTGTKFGFIHTYIHTYTYVHTDIHTYILFKPIILTQEPQTHRNSSKSSIQKFSPLQNFLFEKAKWIFFIGLSSDLKKILFFVTHARFLSFFDLKKGPKVTLFYRLDKKILYLPSGRE